MKKLQYILVIVAISLSSACTNWLEILPQNSQSSDSYWTSKEDVENVLGAGYVKLRACVPTMFDLGELRGGMISANSGKRTNLQTFRVTPSMGDVVNWKCFYEVINMANSVLKYAPDVRGKDQSYVEGALQAHLVEAYFLRAYTYFTLARNWRDVPLILTPYVDDETSYDMPQSPDSVVYAQVKRDILTALESGAARDAYDEIWATKGRATKWALYALMADVCLWTEDYATAEEYCDKILNGEGAFRPVFMEDGTAWFEMFYPGNSNEAIFEIQWNQSQFDQQNTNFDTRFALTNPWYRFTAEMTTKLMTDYLASGKDNRRGLFGTYYTETTEDAEFATASNIWKYIGAGYQDVESVRSTNEKDAHFIIYRVAEILLMKAEALVMQGENRWSEALALVNQVRERSFGQPYTMEDMSEADEEMMLRYILDERNLELAAEGKRWYDLLRFGTMKNSRYRDQFLVEEATLGWTGSTKQWIRSVLKDDNALYLPVWQTELETNHALIQNPYYE